MPNNGCAAEFAPDTAESGAVRDAVCAPPDMPLSGARFPRWALILALTLVTAAALFLFLRGGCAAEPTAIQPSASPAVGAPQLDADFSGLAVWFLDVGQGDCIFLRSPEGKTMLVDSGPAGSFGRIHLFLQRQDVARLDVVVCSHLHIDHIGGMKELFDHYEVGIVYLPPFDIAGSTYANMLASMEENGIPAEAVSAAVTPLQQWDPACEVYVLSPYKVPYDDENDTSIILRVAYGDTAVLLTGDATELAERLAVKAMPDHLFGANVLKVGHHGSDTSTSAKLLSAVQPELAVISVGRGNSYGLPDEPVITRLERHGTRVLRTDLAGTILIALDGERAWVVE